MIVTVSGPTLLSELNAKSTQYNRFYEAETAQSIASDLVSGTGWTCTVSAPFSTEQISIGFMGKTVFQALLEIAEILHCHVREDLTTRTVYIDDFGEDSGIYLTNIERATVETRDYSYIGLIESLTTKEDSEQIINKIIPIGSGEGINAFTLQWCTRSIANGDPYDVQTGTLPDGSTYWYIADATSIAAYGTREAVVPIKDITPLANTPTAFENASNSLYDLAVEVMLRRKDPIVVHDVTANFNKVLPIIVGKYLRCNYAERIEAETGLEPTRTNLITNSGFETNSTGWGSDHTVIRSTAQAHSGVASLRATSTGAGGWMFMRTSLTITAQTHSLYTWLYIPAAWSGPTLSLRANSLTGATGTLQQDANMSIRDAWQKVELIFAPVAGDLTIDVDIQGNSGPGVNGQFFYADDFQLEVGTFPTSYIPTDGAAATRTQLVSGHVVNDDLIIVDKSINYNEDGTTKVALTLAERDAWLLTNEEITIGSIETLAGMRVNLKLYSTFQDHGTMRESIKASGSHWFRYKVRYTDFTHFVHGCWLDFELAGLKANTETAAVKTTDSSGPSSDESADTVTHSHSLTDTPGYTGYNGTDHQHDFSYQRNAGASGGHTHDIAHTHDVYAHDHALVYGIYRDTLPSPATTQVYVNGVLHASYTASQFEVDISDKVVDIDGQPLRQENIVEFRTSASKAYDVIAHAYSFVSVSAIGKGVG